MASDTHAVCTDQQYESSLKLFLKNRAPPHYVLFSASLNDSGVPWCPDCARALPAVTSAMAGAKASLLEVRLERPVWKDKEHPHAFRSAPLNLTGIPTLLHLQPDGTVAHSVGEELEAADTNEASAAVVQAFMAKTGASA